MNIKKIVAILSLAGLIAALFLAGPMMAMEQNNGLLGRIGAFAKGMAGKSGEVFSWLKEHPKTSLVAVTALAGSYAYNRFFHRSLCDRCEAGDYAAVQYALSRGADVKKSDGGICVPLSAAVQHPKVVALILEEARNKGFSASDIGAVFAVLCAVDGHSCYDCVQNCVHKKKQTSLRMILTQYPEIVETGSVKHAFLDACKTGNLDVAKILLENGIDVNLRYGLHANQTPLGCASDANPLCPAMIKLLEDHGAEQWGGHNQTKAWTSNEPMSVEYIIRNGFDRDAGLFPAPNTIYSWQNKMSWELVRACLHADISRIKLLLLAGANPHETVMVSFSVENFTWENPEYESKSVTPLDIFNVRGIPKQRDLQPPVMVGGVFFRPSEVEQERIKYLLSLTWQQLADTLIPGERKRYGRILAYRAKKIQSLDCAIRAYHLSPLWGKDVIMSLLKENLDENENVRDIFSLHYGVPKGVTNLIQDFGSVDSEKLQEVLALAKKYNDYQVIKAVKEYLHFDSDTPARKTQRDEEAKVRAAQQATAEKEYQLWYAKMNRCHL